MARWREKEGKVKVVVQGSEAREGRDSNTNVVVVTMKARERVKRRLRWGYEVVEGGGGDGGETGHVLPLVVVADGAVEGAAFVIVECCRGGGGGGGAGGGVRRGFQKRRKVNGRG